MKINIADISELRERTGAGLSDCKKALTESNGDLPKATEYLRQKGLASVAKKAGKIASEGAVSARVNSDRSKGILLELNCQTDFVSKNENFKELLENILKTCLESQVNSIEELKTQKVSGSNITVEELIAEKTGQIGEKLDLRRLYVLRASSPAEYIFNYTHPIGSRIGVLGKIKNNNTASSGNNFDLGKDIAMHIAAYHTQAEFLSRDSIPAEIFENEKRIELGKEDLANKPEQIKEKIVAGRVEKILLEKVLLEQAFVKDPSKKIKDLLAENKSEILDFKRFDLGEGIEKKESNFAEEVLMQTGKN